MRQHTQPQPLFTVSVASRLAGVSAGRLRRWEEYGLIAPLRDGRARRRLYSWQDIERAQQIRYLVLRRRIPLRAVKVQLRTLAARSAVHGLSAGQGPAGTPLAPRVALAIAR
jgi:DNA-binding transcriptional MerR regulator